MPQPTHSLFSQLGYELADIPDKLYLAKAPPEEGEIEPKLGTFYVALKNGVLTYVVKDPNTSIVQGIITLDEVKEKSENVENLAWPEPFDSKSLAENLPLLKIIWQITAERTHTYSNPEYKQDRKDSPSDHLLLNGQAGGINIATWNTMGKGATDFSAFKYDELQNIYGEGGIPQSIDSGANSRHEQIIDNLAKSVAVQNITLIHAQETNLEAEALAQKLGNNWQVIDSVTFYPYQDKNLPTQAEIRAATMNRVVTCYDTNKFELVCDENGNPDITVSGMPNRYLKVALRDRNTTQITDCYNIWTQFNFFPDEHEILYGDLFRASKALGRAVLLSGDSNTRFASKDKTKKNITKGLIPTTFVRFNPAYQQDNTIQIPDYPDVILYSPAQNEIGQQDDIQQIEGNILNQEGQIHEEPLPNLENMSEVEKLMRHEQRAIFSLTAMLNGLSEEEKELRSWTGDNNVLIRETASSMNERGSTIRFSNKSPFYQQVKVKVQNNLQINIDQYDSAHGATENQSFVTITATTNEAVQILNTAINDVLIENYRMPKRTTFNAIMKERINSRTNKLSPAPVFNFLFGNSSLSNLKKELLEELERNLENVDIKADRIAYQTIVNNWKNQEIKQTNHKGEEKKITVADLMSINRYRIFDKPFTGKTKSQILIEQIEEEIKTIPQP